MSRESEISEVKSRLAADMQSLHGKHRAALERALIDPRIVVVNDSPQGFIVAVAVLDGKLLYWSDIEEGWELETPDNRGNIASRGATSMNFGMFSIGRSATSMPPEAGHFIESRRSGVVRLQTGIAG